MREFTQKSDPPVLPQHHLERARQFLWVDEPAQLQELASRLSTESRVAVDLEADSLYRYRERICLVQLCSSGVTALVDTLALGDLQPLRPMLEDASKEKVFHGADYDLRLLKAVAGINPRGVFDTMVAAQCLGVRQLGLSDLLEARLGVRLEKKFQRADWGKRPLPQAMVQYAVEDTCYLLALRDSLACELEARGRMEWARGHFLNLEKIEPLRREPPDALRTHGARQLDDQGRAVLQALLEWREEEARRRDAPVFKILSTETLVLLAKERPRNLQAMLKTSGITRKVLNLWGEALARAIEEGLRRPPIPLPRVPSYRQNPPGSRRRLLALKEIRDQKANQEGLPPGLLCPNSVLQALAITPPGEIQRRMEELLRPWQLGLLGSAFVQALLGGGRKDRG